MAKLSIVFYDGKGFVWKTEAFLPDDVIFKGMLVEVNDMPVFNQPFAYHDDSMRLHTICSRVDDEIREVRG